MTSVFRRRVEYLRERVKINLSRPPIPDYRKYAERVKALRAKGRSYSEIETATGLSKGTVCRALALREED